MRQAVAHHPCHTLPRRPGDPAAVRAVTVVTPLGSNVLRLLAPHLMRFVVSHCLAQLTRIPWQPASLNLCCRRKSAAGLLARAVIGRLRCDAPAADTTSAVATNAGGKGVKRLGQPATPATDLCGVGVRHRTPTLTPHGLGMSTGATLRDSALHERVGTDDGCRAADSLAEPAVRGVWAGCAG